MRFIFTFAVLSLLLTACGRRETAIHKQLTGKWARGNFGEITYDSDGRFHSRWSNPTEEWLYEGTWDVRNGFIITKITKSEARGSTNFESVGSVDRIKIAIIDGGHLGIVANGSTNYFERK